MRHTWTQEQEAFVEQRYPKLGPHGIVGPFAEKFGVQLTPCAFQKKATRLLVVGIVPANRYSPTEVADMLNISRNAVLQGIQAGRIQASRCGNGRWAITEQEFERLHAYHQRQAPWPALTAEQAADQLGYASPRTVKWAIDRGYLAAVKVIDKATGCKWLVKQGDVDRALQYLRETGDPKVNWVRLRKRSESVCDVQHRLKIG